MKKFKQYLEEGLSPILYHYTQVGNLHEMLKKNQFFLTPALRASAEGNLGNQKVWFLSTSRNKTGGYAVGKFYEKSYQTMIEIDGIKISQKYSGRPVDYWGQDFRKADPVRYNEMEDRIFSDNESIPNLNKYVKAIHIYIPKEGGNFNEVNLRLIRRSLILMKKLGIPYYFYDTKDTFFSQRKPINLDLGLLRVHGKEEFFFHRSKSSWVQDGHAFLRILLSKDASHIMKSEDKVAYKLAYLLRYESSSYVDSKVAQLFNDLTRDEKGRKYLNEITKIMKQNNLKTTKDLSDYAKAKVLKIFGN